MLLIVILSLIILLLIAMLLISYKQFRSACYKDDKSYIKIFEKVGMDLRNRVDLESVEWLKNQELEDIVIDSDDGLKLHASYLKVDKACRTIICVHGYRGNAKYDFSPIIKYLNSLKSNVLLIDQRCTGKSQGEYITYGAKEKLDLVKWINYTAENLDKKNPIYLYGISMGATTSLLSLEYDLPSKVKGVIADCGYSSLKNECKYLFKKFYHFPSFPFLSLFNMFCNTMAHFDMSETDTSVALSKNQIPVLFIHGEKDTFVLPSNTKQNYDANLCAKKDLVWFKTANHGESFIKNSELYHERLEEFFDKYSK